MNPTLTILKEVFNGKSYARTIGNLAVRGVAVRGRTLEIGRGHSPTRPSHWRFLDASRVGERLSADIDPSLKPDIVGDLCARLPVEDAAFDTALCFYVLEHVEYPDRALKEIRRILKPGGRLIGAVPFLVNVHADPHDWGRYTAGMLEKLLKEAGFVVRRLEPVGGPFAAAFTQVEDLLPRFVRFALLPGALALDHLATAKIKDPAARWPVNYVFECE